MIIKQESFKRSAKPGADSDECSHLSIGWLWLYLCKDRHDCTNNTTIFDPNSNFYVRNFEKNPPIDYIKHTYKLKRTNKWKINMFLCLFAQRYLMLKVI